MTRFIINYDEKGNEIKTPLRGSIEQSAFSFEGSECYVSMVIPNNEEEMVWLATNYKDHEFIYDHMRMYLFCDRHVYTQPMYSRFDYSDRDFVTICHLFSNNEQMDLRPIIEKCSDDDRYEVLSATLIPSSSHSLVWQVLKKYFEDILKDRKMITSDFYIEKL